MGYVRVIPCLDIKNGRVVKGVSFQGLVDKGDPVQFAEQYEKQGADEIIFLDVNATVESRGTTLKMLERVSSKVFIPLTAGGGIRTVDEMKAVLRAGADKVSVCSAALRNPDLIRQAERLFGSQCIVVSIDAKRSGGSWNAFTHGGRKDSGVDAVDWAAKCAELGAGEILLNSIDRDGTSDGYDIELIRTVSRVVDIPVISSGGAGSLAQIEEAIRLGESDAVLAASLLHDGKETIKGIKEYLKTKGVDVRC